jgi:hypothetical protein
MWYVREAHWKLNEKGELFDMSDAPFTEKLIVASADTDASKAARARLTAVLEKLNPAGGIPDSGDGTGRHANKEKTTEPAKPGEALDPSAERAAKFDRLDKARTGKLTRDDYTANQSDAVAAAGRFEKMDTNQDGIVTREEYIRNGK